MGRASEAEALLRSLPEDVRREPLINVVLALFDRDGGEERRARALLGSVAECLPGDAASAGAPGAARRVAPDARRDDAAAAPGRDSGGPR